MPIVNKIFPADVPKNLTEILKELETAKKHHADIVIFPDLALCGSSPGEFLFRRTLLDDCKDALICIAKKTENYPAYVIVGLPYKIDNTVVNAYGVIYGGKLVGIVTDDIVEISDDPLLLSPYSSFRCGNISFCLYHTDIHELLLSTSDVSGLGCDLVIIPSSDPVVAGQLLQIRENAKSLSCASRSSIVLCNTGPGETSTPHVYRGFCGVYENGVELSYQSAMLDSISTISDIDSDIIQAYKSNSVFITKLSNTVLEVQPTRYKSSLYRPVLKNPYYNSSINRDSYLSELLDLQVLSLATRMKNSNISKLVLGVSGGVDSTLVLLSSVLALDLLNLPRENLIAVTMPGLGTSERTHGNAIELINRVGATFKEISIKEAVLAHFKDIGHDSDVHDATYENAQARERTQILLDLANSNGAFVAGTGDLSEASLGWCTFGGDHLANFNINATVTKNMARDLIDYVTRNKLISGISDILKDILKTPVSPELLPTDEHGKISQKTEDLLGSYDLHEFFLYYLIHLGLSAKKTLYYATVAFKDDYTQDYIKDKLILFINRFTTSQFKRTTGAESPILTGVHLNGFDMPSDLDPSFLLSELD